MKVAIVGYNTDIQNMWTNRSGCSIVHDIKDADVIQFIGGPDINPSLYGEETCREHTSFSGPSDERDIKAWNASRPDQLRVGICRGGQFLNVMSGGAMWQHIEGHRLIGTHEMVDCIRDRKIDATSTHHQMMIAGKDAEIIAYADGVAKKHHTMFKDGRLVTRWDPEVIWYEKTNSLCFQPHPEFPAGRGALREYYFELINLLR
jgi:Peptidase C26